MVLYPHRVTVHHRQVSRTRARSKGIRTSSNKGRRVSIHHPVKDTRHKASIHQGDSTLHQGDNHQLDSTLQDTIHQLGNTLQDTTHRNRGKTLPILMFNKSNVHPSVVPYKTNGNTHRVNRVEGLEILGSRLRLVKEASLHLKKEVPRFLNSAAIPVPESSLQETKNPIPGNILG